eukprot:6474495-Amphidinium_carterae.3
MVAPRTKKATNQGYPRLSWAEEELQALERESLEQAASEPRRQSARHIPLNQLLQANGGMQAFLQVVRHLACCKSKATSTLAEQAEASKAAERTVFTWVREWLQGSPEQRQAIAEMLAQGIGNLSSQAQARHLCILVESRLCVWKCRDRPRYRRLATAASAAAVSLLALSEDELQQLGETFVESLQVHLTVVNLAIAVVQMPAKRRRQLRCLLVFEGIMEEDSARRLFNAIDSAEGALGCDGLQAILSAMNGAAKVGREALDAGSVLLQAVQAASVSIVANRDVEERVVAPWDVPSESSEDSTACSEVLTNAHRGSRRRRSSLLSQSPPQASSDFL